MALYPLVRPKFFDNNSVLASGYQLFFYEAGTTTKKDTFSDGGLLTANPNPIILNSRGEPDNAGTPIDVYFSSSSKYKVVFASDTDTDPPTSPIWTVDNVDDLAGLASEWTRQRQATYVTATTFTVQGDLTAEYFTDQRLKLTGGADRYSTVLSSSFLTPDTTVTLTDTTDASGVSASLDPAMNSVFLPIVTRGPTSSLPIYEDLADQTVTNKGVSLVGVLLSATGYIGLKLSDWMTDRPYSVLDFMTEAERADVRAETFLVDVTTNFQKAIDYCFINKRRLYLPNGGYRTSLPLVVYGYSDFLNGETGNVVVGESKAGVNIKKFGSASTGNGFTSDVNAVMIIANEDWYNGIESIDTARHLYLEGFTLRGNNADVQYGLATATKFSNSDVREMNIIGYTGSGVFLNENHFVNRFHMMRIWAFDGVGNGDYGFHMANGTSTSTVLTNIYVLSTTVAAFVLKGQYQSCISCAADSNTGIVYDLTRYKGTLLSPGNESQAATVAFKIGQLSNVVITGAESLGNYTDASHVHVQVTAGGKAIFLGGRLAYDGSEADQTMPGFLFTTDSGIGSLHFDNVFTGKYALNDARNPGTPFVSFSGDQGMINTREGGVNLPYMGYDRRAVTDQHVDVQSDTPLILGKAIFMDSQSEPWIDDAGNDHKTTTRSNKGDIFIANSPKSQGAAGWIVSNDGSVTHQTLGTIDIVSGNTFTLSDLTLDSFAKDGQILDAGITITNESGGTAKISTANYVTNVVNVGSKVEPWTQGIGDHIIIPVTTRLDKMIYAKIPIVDAGETVNRPTTSREIGQPYWDKTLSKPIWWNGAAWEDATGVVV